MSKQEEQKAPLPEEIADGGTPQDPGGASSGAAAAAIGENTEHTPSDSSQQRFMDNIRAKYGSEMSDEELYSRLMEDYDKEHEFNKASREDNERLREIMESDPDFAEFAKDMASGGDPVSAMRHMPDDVASYGGENLEARKQLMAQEAGERAKIEAELRETQENLAKSEAAMREYVQKSGMSGEEAEETMKFLSDEVIDPISRGVITPALLELFDKGRKYDGDMEVAKKAGEVAGRNAQISEKRVKMDHSFDGLPNGGATGVTPEAEAKEEDPTVAWLRGVNSKRVR